VRGGSAADIRGWRRARVKCTTTARTRCANGSHLYAGGLLLALMVGFRLTQLTVITQGGLPFPNDGGDI
jgi:hypothetical protein